MPYVKAINEFDINDNLVVSISTSGLIISRIASIVLDVNKLDITLKYNNRPEEMAFRGRIFSHSKYMVRKTEHYVVVAVKKGFRDSCIF